MKAFVKTNNGTFPNLNFYMAWEGFNTMGYETVLFEEKDIDTLDITPETPVFAGVVVFRKVIDKLGIKYPPFDCYPTVLNHYYRRNFRRSTLGEERKKFSNTNYTPVFVKPVLPKQFIGNVWTSILNLIPLAKIPDTAEVWVCEPMDIVSEFRVYVDDGEILGVKHYYGDWSITPDKSFIEDVVRAYKPCPTAYGIDIGVLGNVAPKQTQKGLSWYDSTFVIEVNDGCNLGNYGLDSIHYGEMIVSRWYEIMTEGKVESDIQQQIKDYEQYFPTISDDWKSKLVFQTPEEMKKMYYERWDSGKNYKEAIVSNESEKLRIAAFKKFAEESLKEIRQNDNEIYGNVETKI